MDCSQSEDNYGRNNAIGISSEQATNRKQAADDKKPESYSQAKPSQRGLPRPGIQDPGQPSNNNKLPVAGQEKSNTLPASVNEKNNKLSAAGQKKFNQLPAAGQEKSNTLPAASQEKSNQLPVAGQEKLAQLPAAGQKKSNQQPDASQEKLAQPTTFNDPKGTYRSN